MKGVKRVTRLGKSFANLAKWNNVSANFERLFGQILNLYWQLFDATGQIFIVENCQTAEK